MKKIKLVIMAIIMVASSFSMAQVAINTDGTDADGSAMLEVKSTDKGFLPPRMTEAEMNAIANPVEGLIVYCTDFETDGCLMVYSNAEWKCIFGNGGNYPPGAINITQTGGTYVGDELTGSYVYADTENDPEGVSTFRWYMADDASGSNLCQIITYSYVINMKKVLPYPVPKRN